MYIISTNYTPQYSTCPTAVLIVFPPSPHHSPPFFFLFFSLKSQTLLSRVDVSSPPITIRPPSDPPASALNNNTHNFQLSSFVSSRIKSLILLITCQRALLPPSPTSSDFVSSSSSTLIPRFLVCTRTCHFLDIVLSRGFVVPYSFVERTFQPFTLPI